MQPVIMLLMSGIFMFAVIGGISLLAHYYTLNGIKSKTVGDGQHGTARFATREEIRDTYEQIPYEPELWRTPTNGTGHYPRKCGAAWEALCSGGYG